MFGLLFVLIYKGYWLKYCIYKDKDHSLNILNDKKGLISV